MKQNNKLAINKQKKTKYSIKDIFKLARLTGELNIPNENNNEEKIIEPYKSKPNLNNHIDLFISWYCQYFINYYHLEETKSKEGNDLRNFIEKMAVWYELRYPDYEVTKIIDDPYDESLSIDEIMFINNPYLNLNQELVDELLNRDDSKRINWSRFYSFETFYNSLPNDEKYYLKKPTYPDLIIPNGRYYGGHMHLSDDGYVQIAENISLLTKNKYKDSFFEGFHIKEIQEIFNEIGIILPENNEIEKAIKIFNQRKYFYEELLNCVMYRIIERGGNRIGPRRAFIFAKEFKRNIDIPLIYGIDTTDPKLRHFINEYLKEGGNPNLTCYINYFHQIPNKILETITIKKLLTFDKNNKYRYTNEEKELQQTLAGILANQIEPKKLQQEEIKQSRLTRKLERSKRYQKTK